MSAVLVDRSSSPQRLASPTIALVLLGTGVVGGALLKLLNTPAASSLRLVGAANARRQQTDPKLLSQRNLREQLNQHGRPRDNDSLLASLDASGSTCKVIIDASASTVLASNHAGWLARGYHVVTANKALAGGELAGWRALQSALAHGAHYGDSATVGAGLPVLSTLRRLRLCGDALLALEGVFSGSLSWLFNQYDGSRPFSELLREARQLGYTEPDPRSDLSGEDVARKLLIIARHAGFSISREEVMVESLVPERGRRSRQCAAVSGPTQPARPCPRRPGRSAGYPSGRALVRHRQSVRAQHHSLQHPAAGDPGAGCRTGGDCAGLAGRCAGAGLSATSMSPASMTGDLLRSLLIRWHQHRAGMFMRLHPCGFHRRRAPTRLHSP